MTVEALRETLRRDREDRLPELARYAEIAIGGRKAVFGDEAEMVERRVILERLATLEREIDQIRQQPGMMGHNRPPPEEALTDPSIAEIADAVRGMGEEMERDEPRPREIVDRVTVIERVAKVWRSVQSEALKVKDVAKDEIRKRAVGAVITTVAGGGALYHHEVGKIAAQIVEATLNWLSLIF
ncbi:hypothetical protein [Sphingomonas bacterium]|uniref:hypothetical protein n=1 Tax=Sphingomonas bacterium TaxID=1895847 RepID=UPI0015768EDB|nr:hypothetical protein [Sphingomonas bacterium]